MPLAQRRGLARRRFLQGGALAAASLAVPPVLRASTMTAENNHYDFIIVGAGTAGIPAAIFAARRGARVLLLDAASVVGGTLHLANGQISGAGTRLQRELGIDDTPDRHFDDVMRVTGGTANPDIVRLTVDHAATTLDWLERGGLVPLPGHPVTGEAPGRPMYTRRRYLWAEREGPAILDVVNRELAPEIARGRVRTQLDTRVTELLTDDSGAVVGVRAERSGGQGLAFRGAQVLLTTGGYASNLPMFRRLSGHPNYAGGSYPFSQGDGLDLAVSVGGFLRGREHYRTGFGSILENENYPAKVSGRFVTVPQTRPPWEIYVNVHGERFVAEDEPRPLGRERALLRQPEVRYWIVFDQEIFERAPPGVQGWTREQMLAAFATHPMFARGDSLASLAERAGIAPAGLEGSVREYNAALEAGRPDPFGRAHRPLPIRRGPYYAIRHQGHSATSAAGVAVDRDLRVLRGDGSFVPNLYAAGEILGSGATIGNAFAAGMMLTPALTFGRLLGERLPLMRAAALRR
jgi:fumarate reductase flavoprotein subunit